MESKTLYRCGLVWLIFALFLVDGGQFIRADEKKAEAGEDDATIVPSGQIATAEGAVPNWFKPDAKYSADAEMLFVQTDMPCSNEFEAKRELGQECVQAVHRVLDQWFGEPAAGEKVGIDQEYVFLHLIFDERIEVQKIDDRPEVKESKAIGFISDGEFLRGYAQLHLNDEFRKYAQSRWREVQTKERLVGGGLIGASVLAMLAVIFGYLKMETATRGFYSRRLQTAMVMFVILVLAGAFWFRHNLVLP